MSEGKVRVIIKRPDEKFGHVTNISVRLENLQKTVDPEAEDFCDLAFSFKTWKDLLKVWGN